MNKETSLKVRVQKLGTALSNMVMPNIPVLIAWGVLTMFFIPNGFTPNKTFAALVGPMLSYLIPLMIGYTGGKNIYEHRGGVVGAIATFGAILATAGAAVGGLNGTANVPMILGAMILGPLGGWLIKKVDQIIQPRVRAGLEMLVNNFSAGLVGFALALFSVKIVGPVVAWLTDIMGHGVNFLVQAHLIPLANLFIEPAKILFLNNAINQGILTPLGIQQASEHGKSLLFLLEANPGPGFGLLLAFMFFGKGSAKATAPGAVIIQFIGGIHEIYFPYVMMKPALFLAVMAGGVSGTLTNNLLGSGLYSGGSYSVSNSYISTIGANQRKGFTDGGNYSKNSSGGIGSYLAGQWNSATTSFSNFDWKTALAAVGLVMVAGIATIASQGEGGDPDVITPYDTRYSEVPHSPQSDNLADIGSPLFYDDAPEEGREYNPEGGNDDPE